MPLFSVLLGSIASAFANFFGLFLGYKAALKLAAYTAWLTVFLAFLAVVYVCASSLYGMMGALVTGINGSGISWVSMFFMGLGMFVPANAAAVLACVGSVWIGTGIYKFQKDAIQNFGA